MKYYKSGTSSLLLTLLLLCGITILCTAQSSEYRVTVSAAGFDRTNTFVSFTLPEKIPPGIYRMQGENGNPVLLQVDDGNTGWFLLEKLPAGRSRSYILRDERISTEVSEVSNRIDENTVTFSRDDRPILSYYYRLNDPPENLDPVYRRAGYLHPVFSPSGVPVTNHLDQKMHPHHYGIWSAWTHTEFQGRSPDFWNVHDHSGRVDHADSLELAWTGPVQGGFQALHHYVDLTGSAPVIALNEQWKVTVFNTPHQQYNLFELELTQTANTGQPLILPEYRYGGMAIRGHGNWDEPDNVTFLTSKGYDRIGGNTTRARWCYMGGTVDGERTGIAVLSHPGNHRAPQPVRIHPEIPYFVYTPVQLGDMAIRPGFPYTARYRYVTLDGKPDPADLNRLWYDFAYPPAVSIK